MKDEKLMPKEWSAYPGDYEKVQYDIKTIDGIVYENCWPNAGKFNCLKSDGAVIPGHLISEFKVSERFWFGEDQGSQEID